MRGLTVLILLFLAIPLVGQNWSTLNKKGLSLYQKGDYPKAVEYLLRAVASSSEHHGYQSQEHVVALTNLAYVKKAQGDYRQAQDNFRKALKITLALYDSVHIEEIEAITNLANAFLPSGDYDSCEFYFEYGRQQIVRAVQERSPHYLRKVHLFFDALINVQAGLASLYFKKGQADNAIDLLVQQRVFIQQTYPDDYFSLLVYKSTINNLATYYLSTGDVSKSVAIVKEQLAIAEHSRKKEPLKYLEALNNLGTVYRQKSDLDSAFLVWQKALTIINGGIAQGSDIHVSLLNNVGELELARDHTARSVEYLLSSSVIQEKRAAINPRIYQTTLLNLADALHWNGNNQKADETYAKLTTLLMDEVLHNFTYLSDAEKISFYRNNAYILEYFSWFAFEVSGFMTKQPLKDSFSNPDALKRLLDLRLITKGLILHPGYRLKNVITAGDVEISQKYKKWEDAKYSYAALRRADTLDVGKLSALSQQAEALEKWLRTNSPEFTRGFVIEKKTWKDVQQKLGPEEVAVELVRLADGMVYGALILTATTTDGPVAAFVKSTEKFHLEKQFYSQYANAVTHDFADTISYRIYWEPIVNVIRNHISTTSAVQKIYLSADGIYHNINVNTLLNPQTQKYVLEETDVRHVTSLKDILEIHPATNSPGTAVFVGRPEFSASAPDRNLFPDLPGTEVEVNIIEKLLLQRKWTAKVLMHDQAQESFVKKLRSPTILHLATHGFFLDQADANDFTDVLLNSGIALAGAEDGRAEGGEDGILTAYEMMNIDFDRTNLVVLSACETGLGTFYSGEGVYGLQRAIRSAGARGVIMSLWKVDDVATQKLMTTFYSLWVDKQEDPRGAFRMAQQELKVQFPDPKYWGAFVYME